MKVDSHIHLYDPFDQSVLGWFWPPKESSIYRPMDGEEFLAQAKDSGIDKAIVVACTRHPSQVEQVYRMDHDCIAAVIGFTEMFADDFREQYARLSVHPKFRGFRCDAREEPTRTVYDNFAVMEHQKANVVEFLGGRGGMEKLYPVFDAFPGINFVIEHCAMLPTAGEPTAETVEYLSALAHHENVSLKISGLTAHAKVSPIPTDPAAYAPILRAFLNAFGEDRLVFGTDWPNVVLKGCAYSDSADIVEGFFSAVSPSAAEKVMGGNAIRIYSL